MTYKLIFNCCVAFIAIGGSAVQAQGPTTQRLLRQAYKQRSPIHTGRALENMDFALGLDQKRTDLHFYKQIVNLESQAEIALARGGFAAAKMKAVEIQRQAVLEDRKSREAFNNELIAIRNAQVAAQRVTIDIQKELQWTPAILRTDPKLRQELQRAVHGNALFAEQGVRDVALVRQIAGKLYQDARIENKGFDFSHLVDAHRYLRALVHATEHANSVQIAKLANSP